jgi:O-antigen ligase
MTFRTGWPRPSAALAVASALMPPLATVVPLSLATLLPLAAVAALALGGHRELRRLLPARPFAALLLSVGLLGLASALWSIVPGHSAITALRFIGISASGLALSAVALSLEEAERERVRRALLAGVVAALLVLAAAAIAHLLWRPAGDGLLSSWLRQYTRFNRGTTTLALAIWPAVIGSILVGKRYLAASLLAATAVVVIGLVDHSAVLALAMGIAVWPIASRFPGFSAAAIGAGLVALAVLLPMAPLDAPAIVRIHAAVPAIKPSGLHRLEIWHFASERIAERPLLGWGLDASRAIPGGSERVDDPSMPWLIEMSALRMPLHPHNAALQWRLELGLPGAVLMTLTIWWPLWRARSAAGPPSRRATALAALAGGLVVAMLSYGFWQAWWQASLWLVAAAFLAVSSTAAGND